MTNVLVDQGMEILTEDVCLELLGGEEVGRVAVSVSALPAIFPVNYRMVDGDVLFRTGDGIKARSAVEGNVVCFEVDHLDLERHSGWSVLLVGRARLVPEDQAVDALKDLQLSPWAGSEASRLVRIHPEFVSGRRIVGERQSSPAQQ